MLALINMMDNYQPGEALVKHLRGEDDLRRASLQGFREDAG